MDCVEIDRAVRLEWSSRSKNIFKAGRGLTARVSGKTYTYDIRYIENPKCFESPEGLIKSHALGMVVVTVFKGFKFSLEKVTEKFNSDLVEAMRPKIEEIFMANFEDFLSPDELIIEPKGLQEFQQTDSELRERLERIGLDPFEEKEVEQGVIFDVFVVWEPKE